MKYSDRDPYWGRRKQGMKKSQFSTNISLYLWNDTRKDHSYYGTPRETDMRSMEWCYFQCSWVTLSDLAKFSVTRSILPCLSATAELLVHVTTKPFDFYRGMWCWLRDTVVERSTTLVFEWRTFPVLRSTCSWRVTSYVGKPSAVGQPTRPTQPFILSG